MIHRMSQDIVKQLSLGFLLAQTVKNLPAMRKTQVRSLYREDPLEESLATHYPCLENPHGQRSLAGYSP